MENNSNQRKQAEVAEDFFLPDLCEVKSVLFLLLLAELLAIVLELEANALRYFSWTSFALKSMFVQWAVLSSAALLCYLRPLLSRRPRSEAAAYSFILIIVVEVVLNVVGQLLVSGVLSASGQWQLDGLELLTNALICAVLAGITLRYFYLAQQLHLRQQAELEARIQALQSRIRPHFLFNSMNIIASLIAIDQEAAETAVEDLSELFRASLAETGTEVALAEEVALCRRYQRIEQLRLGDKLRVNWQLDPALEVLPIPSLCLQPLLENAIYHGIQRLSQGGAVLIRASFEQGMLTIEVLNPLPEPVLEASGPGGQSQYGRAGNRIALANIHRRLQAIYGPSAGLQTSQQDGQFRAAIVYPLADGVDKRISESAL